jgi:hypothetical protein
LRHALVVFAAFAVASPAAAQDQPIVQQVEEHRNDVGEIDKVEGRFIHRASGFIFPSALGDMPARKTTTYGPADASVDYTLKGGGNGDAWITLFVYRAQVELDAEVITVTDPIVQRWSAKPIAHPPALPSPGAMKDGWFAGQIDTAAYTTGYRLARRGEWYLKVRFTIPAELGRAGIDRAVTAIAAVPWDWLPSKSISVREEGHDDGSAGAH